MIWIVSKRVSGSESELKCRHQFIENVTQVRVSPWNKRVCAANRRFQSPVEFYQCASNKGEYGIIITAHINEVLAIVENVLTNKKALVIVNSCIIKNYIKNKYLGIVKARNSQSKLFFARQERSNTGVLLNYIDNVGTFGFATSVSERELFIHRKEGLIKAIRLAFDEVLE